MRRDPRLLAAILLGGFVGTACRAQLGAALPHATGAWPWATLIANVAGAFTLAAIASRLVRRAAAPGSEYLRGLLSVGFCGALTTFSTLQLELVQMVQEHDAGLAVLYGAVSLAAGLAAVWVAWRLAGGAAPTGRPVGPGPAAADAADAA